MPQTHPLIQPQSDSAQTFSQGMSDEISTASISQPFNGYLCKIMSLASTAKPLQAPLQRNKILQHPIAFKRILPRQRKPFCFRGRFGLLPHPRHNTDPLHPLSGSGIGFRGKEGTGYQRGHKQENLE